MDALNSTRLDPASFIEKGVNWVQTTLFLLALSIHLASAVALDALLPTDSLVLG